MAFAMIYFFLAYNVRSFIVYKGYKADGNDI